MKVITFAKFGGPEVLQLNEKTVTKPADDEVLIKVSGAGINPIDYKIRQGTSFVAEKLKEHLPSGLGYELSGEIVLTGKQVTAFNPGDLVFGLAGFSNAPGCYAEYVITTPDYLIHKPEKLAKLDAACMTLASLTALQALQLASSSDNWKDKSILIHAGAGGVGHFAVQLAHLWGARVITTASAQNHDFLYTLGANQCIDYHHENFLDVVSDIDIVLDLVGGNVGLQSLNLLSKSGYLVTVPTITAAKIIEAAKQKGIAATGMVMKPNMTQLSDLAQQVATGKLQVEIGNIFRLEEAQEAHQLLETNHARGKLVFNLEKNIY